MRFAILGISHETNTFSIVPATYDEFEKRGGLFRGQEMIDEYAEAEFTISGYLQAAEEALKQALERTNQVFAEAVARFREQVAAGLKAKYFPMKEPLSIDWSQPR